MPRDVAARKAFVLFLERFGAGTVETQDWQQHAETHYADKFLEEFRRCVVRLDGMSGIEESHRSQMFQHWAIAVSMSLEDQAD